MNHKLCLKFSKSKRNESAQRCPRVEDFQVCCTDFGCQDCLDDSICLDNLHDEAIIGTAAQNVINQLPSANELLNLTRNFGHTRYEDIDRTRIGFGESKLT